MAAVGTGVTIGSRSIRVVQVKKQKDGTWQVLKALSAPVSGGDGRVIAEARSALASAGAKGRSIVGLSGKDLIVRYTQVPPVPDWRLEMLMNFEIQEVSEQSGGDVSADYALLDVDDTTSGDNVVLVALAKNGFLKPRLEAMKGAGLDVLGGCPRSIGAFTAYQQNGHLRHDETVVMMNIGNENTDVAVARNGVLLFARNISGGSQLFTDALVQNMRVNAATAEKLKITKGNLTPRGQAKYRDSGEEKVANNLMGVGGHFVSAFNSSVMFARAQTKVPDCDPDRLVIMGGGAMLRGLPEYLESNLGVPVELFDPVDSLDLSSLSGDAQNALRQEQGAASVAIGLAQMAAEEESFRVEILPEADKKRRHFMQETLPVILAGAILLIGVILAFVFSASAQSAAYAEREMINDKSRLFDENRGAYVAAKERVAQVNDQMHRLRRMVGLGPAAQRMTDLTQGIINDLNFDEIYIEQMQAELKEVNVDGDRDVLPQVEFHAVVKPIGGRATQTAMSQFGVAMGKAVEAAGGFEYGELGTPEASGDGVVRFRFRIRQVTFPERVEEPTPDEGE